MKPDEFKGDRYIYIYVYHTKIVYDFNVYRTENNLLFIYTIDYKEKEKKKTIKCVVSCTIKVLLLCY